ncbi:MAG: hypothetical protein AB7R55_05000 [Gemmatimonadales bacterium]
MKLKRDLALLDAEVTSDRFFNFVITARHLPEWLEKDPTCNSSAVAANLVPLKASAIYRACRDIADASKHFSLNQRRQDQTDVTHVDSGQGYGIGRFGHGAFGVGEELISISLSDGTEWDARVFAHELAAQFESLFLEV